jgi:hypothetical protein
MKKIIRSFDDGILDRVKTDFEFLVNRVRIEDGELDLRLRNNYFNLYYKGNSLAKVNVKSQPYQIEINKAFIETNDDHPKEAINSGRFGKPVPRGDYFVYEVEAKNLHAFLSKQTITQLYRRIKNYNYSEELILEQLLIASNRHRQDFIIIDRQIQGGALGRIRVDLLGLRRTGDNNQYHFEIIEVKMGNNPELRREVANQLDGYMKIMTENFDDFQQCYQRTYRQMKQLGLLTADAFEEVTIVKPVRGVVVVGGYPGLAQNAIKELKQNHDDLMIKTICYQL